MNRSVSIYCPFCHRYTALRVAVVKRELDYNHEVYIPLITDEFSPEWAIGVCNWCNRTVLFSTDGAIIYPEPLPEPTNKLIPDSMRQDFDEAKKCSSVHCYRAACVLCRRAIQSACKAKGAEGTDLFHQIEDLQGKGILTKDLADFAHTIRGLGRDAAHPDFGPVAEDDAKDCLALADQFLYLLFVTPAIAAERKRAREKKA